MFYFLKTALPIQAVETRPTATGQPARPGGFHLLSSSLWSSTSSTTECSYSGSWQLWTVTSRRTRLRVPSHPLSLFIMSLVAFLNAASKFCLFQWACLQLWTRMIRLVCLATSFLSAEVEVCARIEALWRLPTKSNQTLGLAQEQAFLQAMIGCLSGFWWQTSGTGSLEQLPSGSAMTGTSMVSTSMQKPTAANAREVLLVEDRHAEINRLKCLLLLVWLEITVHHL